MWLLSPGRASHGKFVLVDGTVEEQFTRPKPRGRNQGLVYPPLNRILMASPWSQAWRGRVAGPYSMGFKQETWAWTHVGPSPAGAMYAGWWSRAEALMVQCPAIEANCWDMEPWAEIMPLCWPGNALVFTG